jgi:hypothetical protein
VKAHPEAWSSRTTAFGSVLSLPLGDAVPTRTAPRHRRTLDGGTALERPAPRRRSRLVCTDHGLRLESTSADALPLRPSASPFSNMNASRFQSPPRDSKLRRTSFQSPPRDSKLRRTRISKDVTRTRERAARPWASALGLKTQSTRFRSRFQSPPRDSKLRRIRFQSPPRDSKLRRTRVSKDVTRTRERAARPWASALGLKTQSTRFRSRFQSSPRDSKLRRIRFQSPPRDSKLRRTRIPKDVTRTRERAARPWASALRTANSKHSLPVSLLVFAQRLKTPAHSLPVSAQGLKTPAHSSFERRNPDTGARGKTMG